MKLRVFIFCLLLLGLVWLSGCDNVTEDYRLEDGERLEDGQHLVVVDANLEKGSVVEGDLNISASQVTINGQIEGDLTIVASQITLGSDAQIKGDLIYCLVDVRKGSLKQQTGALVWGRIRNSCDNRSGSLALNTDESSRRLLRLFSNSVMSLAMGLLTAFATVIVPHPMKRIQITARQNWYTAIGLGFLTLLVAVGLSGLWRLSLVIIVPLIFAPIVALGWAAIVAMSLLGSVSIAQSFGAWLITRLGRQPHVPLVSGMIGGTLLTFFILSFRLVHPAAFLTSVTGLLVISWGLGTALLTRVGTCDYVAARQAASVTKA